jgi:hypothetical protein
MLLARRWLTVAALAALAGCQAGPRFAWVRPPGVSGRDSIRDKMVCRELAGVPQLLTQSTGTSAVDALFYASAVETAISTFEQCMTEAGYRKVPVSPAPPPR